MTGPDAAAELEAFSRGERDGLDPQPATEEFVDGRAVTNAFSSWHLTRCTTCGHSFRRGDRVIRDDDGDGSPVAGSRARVRHLDPALRCEPSGDDEQVAESARAAMRREEERFSAGLLSAWPSNVEVRSLSKEDFHVAKSGDALDPPICVNCGHTFREGECIVVCPCHPDAPRCETAIHRDPARGLTCWERWRPEGEVAICPMRQIRVEPLRSRGG